MILIGGCMRSGTTLLQSILCSSTMTNPMMRECDFLIELAALYKRNLSLFEARSLGQYFGSKASLRQYMSSCVSQFLANVHTRFPDASVLVMKNPELTPLFPSVFDLLPDTRFLLTVRDPRDTIASMMEVNKRYRVKKEQPPIDFSNDVMQAANYLLAIYSPILDRADTDPSFQERVLFVRYEYLCTNPRESATHLSEFTGIKLDNYAPDAGWNTLVGFSGDSPWNSSSYGKEVSADRIGSFAETLSKEQVSQINNACNGFMRRFGYED